MLLMFMKTVGVGWALVGVAYTMAVISTTREGMYNKSLMDPVGGSRLRPNADMKLSCQAEWES